MAPCWENTFLFCSSQQLPRLRLMRCSRNHRVTSTALGVVDWARRSQDNVKNKQSQILIVSLYKTRLFCCIQFGGPFTTLSLQQCRFSQVMIISQQKQDTIIRDIREAEMLLLCLGKLDERHKICDTLEEDIKECLRHAVCAMQLHTMHS